MIRLEQAQRPLVAAFALTAMAAVFLSAPAAHSLRPSLSPFFDAKKVTAPVTVRLVGISPVLM
ncbi:hypothetical protein [Novosphingobium sp. P6W]|uniref:hypothetical protein n=1 Tax=Novosphingobium sp. P6W TaxID=1609758 RepID=UPI0005C2DDC2|nr:hypothetical protein [Novosphingobium sp. P6W]KIS32583.1 hypothetical protein TQ38_09695 [Novosphingobium sp. P6W]